MYTVMGSVVYRVLAGTVLALLCCAAVPLYAQDERGEDIPQVSGIIGTEIHSIRFDNSSVFTDEVLLGLVSSRATELGLIDQTLEFYSDQVREHPNAPDELQRFFRRVSKDLDQFRQYFNRETVQGDVEDIERLYDVNGYHNARARAYVVQSSRGDKNTLVFEIQENAPARLDTVVWLGLEEIPKEVEQRIIRERKDSLTGVFRASLVGNASDRVLNVLRNNGYYFASRQRPIVSFDEARNSDSVTIQFFPGPRVRIGTIKFVDSTRGQYGVSQSTRRRQLEFQEGDWYSAEAVENSVQNIYALGTYERVSIDTVGSAPRDSTVNLTVFTVTRDLGEYGATILFDKDFNEDFWNLGLEANIIYRNLFGGAQQIQAYGRGSIVDFTGTLTEGFPTIATELLIGGGLSQPYLFSIDDRPIDGALEVQYSDRTVPIDKFDLTLVSVNSSIQFGMRLQRHTLFQRLGLQFSYSREAPVNLAEDRQTFLESGADAEAVNQILYQYQLLDNAEANGSIFTMIAAEFTAVGDTRNHPFSPTAGYLLSGGVKYGILPISSSMTKIDINLLGYLSATRTGTAAFKLRSGHIWWNNKDNGGPIPANEMYFVGGSSSLRAWSAREVRTEPVTDELSTDKDIREAAQQTGSGTMLETSLEWRQKFTSRTSARTTWDKQLIALGVVGFVDAGNTENSLLQKAEGYTNNPFTALSNIFQEMAVGVGFGIRYDLPFGPLRLDFATRLHDPLRETEKWIWERPLRFYWRVGIGHAF